MTLLSRNALFFVLCFAFLLSIQVVYSYSLEGMQLQDLEGTGNDFKADAANWYATIKASTDTWSDCAGTLLVGGYGVLGAATGNSKNSYLWRTYTGLPDHTMIIYTFKMYLLDTWDLSTADGFRYSFDDKAIAGWTADFSMFGPSVCGTSYQDATDIIIFGSAVHSGNSLTFKLISDLDEPPTNEAFGIRDISFTFYQGPVTTTTQCITTSVALSDRKCQCSEGYYYTGSTCSPCNGNCQSCYAAGTGSCYACKLASGIGYDGFNCINCHSYCDQCFGTSNTQCTACKAGYSYVAAENTCLEDCPYPMVRATSGTSYTCTSPCTSGQSVYWDQSCGTCAAPLVTKVAVYTTTVSLCTYPCSSSEYLYWDGTCQADCEYPLATTVTKGKKFCTYKCTSSQFLDWNNNCVSSCASPLVPKIVSGSKLCFAPCDKPGDYLYWNNECASACDLPFVQRTTNNIKYCDFRCTTATDYLYWNNTCAATCDAPLKARIEMGKNFCDFPADPSKYLYWDGTQSSTCPSPPLTPYNEGTSPVLKFCGYGCDLWEYLYWDGSCALDCLFPFSPRVANGRKFCDYPCTGTDIPLWNGTCVDPSFCVLPLQLNTVAGKQVCDFPAGNVSNYLYWDGSFEATCPTPLISRIEGSPMVRKFCDFPCTSPSLPILNFDGTCISSCNSPSVPRPEYSQQFCDFSCGTEFEYYNTSCYATCDTPFVQQISGAGQYCNHPCTTTTDFYYWDGTCNADCSSPLQQYSYNGIDWCLYPCSATQFLTNDGICLDSCDAPFQSSTVSNLKYCGNPCTSSEYLFWDGTCLQSCDSPLRSYTSLAGKSCDTPCDTPEEYYQELTGECVKQCDTTTVSVDGLYYKCLANRDDNSTFLDLLLDAPSNQVITLVAPPNLLEYVKYLNISSPPRFQKFVQSKGLTPLTLRFGPKMSNEMREDFPKESLPTVFDQAGVHSNFIVNFYQEITSFAIVIGTVVLLTVISAICENRNWETAKIFFDKLIIILKWNYIFVLITTSILKVIIYVTLQFKTADSDSSFSGISIELCLIAMSLSLITVIASYWLVLKQQAVRQEGPPHKISEFFVAWQGYQVLYRGFKDVSWSTSYFLIFYLIRLILVGLIASLLYMTPAFQTAAYLILSISMLAYIAKTKPLIRKVNLIQLIIFESLVLIVNVSLFALVLLQRNGKGDSSTAVMFGDIAIAGISSTNILALAMLAVKLFYGAIAIYKSSSSKQRRDPSTWLSLLVYGLQQGGMGFEEVSLNPGIETETKSELGVGIQESQAISKRGAKLKLSHVYPGDDNTNLLATKVHSPALELNVSNGSGENLSPTKTIQRTSIFSNNDSPLFKTEEASKKSKFTFLNMDDIWNFNAKVRFTYAKTDFSNQTIPEES